MLDWQELSQQLRRFVNTFVRFVKARRRSSKVTNLEPLLKLNIQTLILALTTEQRMSLKTLPESVTSLQF
jgi:hypothetical protein